MKLRTMAMVVIGVGALAGACSKKPKEGTPPPEKMSGTGAGTGAGTAAEPVKEAKLEGKGLADKYLECLSHLNGAKWDDFQSKCVAKDYKGRQADGPDTTGSDALMEFFKGQRTAFPDMKFQPQLVLVNGRNILAVNLVTGTHTGPLEGPMGEVAATNKKIGLLMFHRLAIDDENRAAEEMAYLDPATMAAQLGLVPEEAPPSRPVMETGMEGAPVVAIAADDAGEKKNLETWQKAQDALKTRKAADYMAFHADDTIESDQAGEKDAKGKKEIQAGTEFFLKAFPDLKLESAGTFAAGDYVVDLGTFSGTNNGPLGPMKPTKKKVSGQYAEVVKMKDGKIVQLWRFRNGMAMAIQLGLMNPPGAPPAGAGSAAPAPK